MQVSTENFSTYLDCQSVIEMLFVMCSRNRTDHLNHVVTDENNGSFHIELEEFEIRKDFPQSLTVQWLHWKLDGEEHFLISFEEFFSSENVTRSVDWIEPSTVEKAEEFKNLVLSKCPHFPKKQIPQLRKLIKEDFNAQ